MTSGILFRIETNVGFAWLPVVANEKLRNVAHRFGQARDSEFEEIRKPSLTSRIFRAQASASGILLRRVPPDRIESTIRQCEIMVALNQENTVRPLPIEDRSRSSQAEAVSDFVLRDMDGAGWMAYAALPGQIYSGQGDQARRAIAAMIGLQRAFKDLEASLLPDQKAATPAARHRPEIWAATMGWFLDRSEPDHPAQIVISAETRTLLSAHAQALHGLVRELSKFEAGNDSGLVHNDVNHANVVVGPDGTPGFLDIEDICFESRAIALMHGVFKLLRHAVYTGAASVDQRSRDIFGSALTRMEEADLASLDRTSAFAFGAYRIVSEIVEIIETARNGDHSRLYDLEKKLHNLFELAQLIAPDHELAA